MRDPFAVGLAGGDGMQLQMEPTHFRHVCSGAITTKPHKTEHSAAGGWLANKRVLITSFIPIIAAGEPGKLAL